MIVEPQKSQAIDPEVRGKARSQSAQIEAQQSTQAQEETRALEHNLMERISTPLNLNQAAKRVRKNKGSAGVDRMKVEDLPEWMAINQNQLIKSLLEGSYQPQPVRAVEIPKPGGGVRELCIPTVIDRLVQQAILQVLTLILDPTFSESSYGFRPKRSAHQALAAASGYVKEGYHYVVDLDLEKFFDRVNHDVLMSRLARRIGDKRLLRLIRRYLQAGMFRNGIELAREMGTPQGGPLSPLLANLLLDEFDKELEKRGHRFCRYADDCNIYVRSEQSGLRVMQSVTNFLAKRLRLKVNTQKSAVARVEDRQFLGYRLLTRGRLAIAPKSIKRVESRIRELTGRHCGRKLVSVIRELNKYLIGWLAYYRYAMIRGLVERLDRWIRQRLRCIRLVQCKHRYAKVKFLVSLDVDLKDGWNAVGRNTGPWRLSRKTSVVSSMTLQWFKLNGLLSLLERFDALKRR